MKQRLAVNRKDLKDTIINKLMDLGVYKIRDLQLYQVPLYLLLHEYDKHPHD